MPKKTTTSVRYRYQEAALFEVTAEYSAEYWADRADEVGGWDLDCFECSIALVLPGGGVTEQVDCDYAELPFRVVNKLEELAVLQLT